MNTARRFLSALGFTALMLGHNARAQIAQPWAGAAVSDWAGNAKAAVVSDLSRCEPASALSDMVLSKGRWKVIPYEMAKGGYTGKMIWAPSEANSPEVSIAPGVEGWHAIFVGLFSATEVPTTAWIRLDTDVSPVPRHNRRTSPQPYSYGHSEEVFFRAVRLRKDSRLLFSPQSTGELAACGITHIKLIPLTDEEVGRI